MTEPAPQPEEGGLDAARERLSGLRGRPFDVDKVLADNRAKEERARTVAREAAAQLERARALARERRHAKQVEQIELEKESLSEHVEHIEEAKRRAARRDPPAADTERKSRPNG